MTTTSWSRLTVVATLVAALSAIAGAVAPGEAAATAATIHPGVQVTIGDITCTAGAILHQKSAVYVAIPASCTGTQQGVPQDGCGEAVAPVGSPATIGGATHKAVLVYNSFTRMQSVGTTKVNRCADNDLALLQLNKTDRSRAIGTIPGTKAPTAVALHMPAKGTSVTLGTATGTSEGATDANWAVQVMTMSMPTASDIGEPLVDASHIVGMLTVLPTVLPFRPYSTVVNLHRAMILLRKVHGFHHVGVIHAGKRG